MCNEDVDASSYHPRAAAKLSAPLLLILDRKQEEDKNL